MRFLVASRSLAVALLLTELGFSSAIASAFHEKDLDMARTDKRNAVGEAEAKGGERRTPALLSRKEREELEELTAGRVRRMRKNRLAVLEA